MSAKYTCKQALDLLKKGNAKHVALERLKANAPSIAYSLEIGVPDQEPYAAILGCADSRVIPERIFSAKEGELFVVRVAGNVASTEAIASLEYAVKKLKVPVILVLGHQACGAVEAAIELMQKRQNAGYNLNQLISHIIPAINDPSIDDLQKAVMKNAVIAANDLIGRSEYLRSIPKKSLLICAAYYHISGPRAGKVEFIGTCACAE